MSTPHRTFTRSYAYKITKLPTNTHTIPYFLQEMKKKKKKIIGIKNTRIFRKIAFSFGGNGSLEGIFGDFSL